jgi:anhydro-N-acetylmuramic acid kinase
MSEFYIGIMSGTSADAVDVVLVDLTNGCQVQAHHTATLSTELRKAIHSLAVPGRNEINTCMDIDVELGRLIAAAVRLMLKKAAVAPSRVHAIGSHGQTVRHRPDGDRATTLQLGDPNIIAEETGITVVADLRRRDMAAGGQGAPLVPAFHQSQFQHRSIPRVVVNIGGIANVTALAAGLHARVTGFDTGPGNTLMDQWIQASLKQPYDKDGQWATSGKYDQNLLQRMLRDSYFSKTPPKSTGPEHFNLRWLEKILKRHGKRVVKKNVQATLCELTAVSITEAIQQHAPGTEEVLVCGGGVHNLALMYRLQALLQPLKVFSTEDFGLDPDRVEAAAFAWLAQQTLNHRPGNIPAVTGARHAVILGAVYPA